MRSWRRLCASMLPSSSASRSAQRLLLLSVFIFKANNIFCLSLSPVQSFEACVQWVRSAASSWRGFHDMKRASEVLCASAAQGLS